MRAAVGPCPRARHMVGRTRHSAVERARRAPECGAMKLAFLLCLVATPALADRSMTFFVTSKGPGSANLGGLTGADRHCQQLAAAAGAGAHTWRAYLSAAPDTAAPAVDARDRIGVGPWTNARGVVIARDLHELHG